MRGLDRLESQSPITINDRILSLGSPTACSARIPLRYDYDTLPQGEEKS